VSCLSWTALFSVAPSLPVSLSLSFVDSTQLCRSQWWNHRLSLRFCGSILHDTSVPGIHSLPPSLFDIVRVTDFTFPFPLPLFIIPCIELPFYLCSSSASFFHSPYDGSPSRATFINIYYSVPPILHFASSFLMILGILFLSFNSPSFPSHSLFMDLTPFYLVPFQIHSNPYHPNPLTFLTTLLPDGFHLNNTPLPSPTKLNITPTFSFWLQ
jgi:hypothetical protein